MGTCRNHPDVETPYLCQKHGYYLCQACLACHDPELYCTFRSSCLIYFMAEKGETLDHAPAASPETSTKGESA
ncbi:MAG TPA: hypothetical protein DDX99_09250 [Desulfofustis sp.]|jgi:hypothetical protein|nr:hypothetical protein [Desulfofustis sp.]